MECYLSRILIPSETITLDEGGYLSMSAQTFRLRWRYETQLTLILSNLCLET